jgi:glyoxalase family protein
VPDITPAMALEGIHHISGITRDLDQAGEFYERTLGLRLVKKTVNQDDPTTLHYFWATYDGHEVAKHSAMTLFGWPRGGRTARAGRGQTEYVAFRAADADQLLSWRDHLLSSGIATSDVIDDGHFQSLAFAAPDGQALRLTTDGPGFDVG